MDALTTINVLLNQAKHMGMTDIVQDIKLTLGGLVDVDMRLPFTKWDSLSLSMAAQELSTEINVRSQLRRAFPSLY